MKCTDCRYFDRSIINGTQWCEAGICSKRIQWGDEIKDLPCRKFKEVKPENTDTIAEYIKRLNEVSLNER
jgi:hypothetical protein